MLNDGQSYQESITFLWYLRPPGHMIALFPGRP